MFANHCICILLLCPAFLPFVEATDSCSFSTYEKDENKTEIQKALKRLQPLMGKRFSATDVTSKEQYTYYIGVCTHGQATPSPVELKLAGVVQEEVNEETKKTTRKSGGSFTKARITNGTEWVQLEYLEGDQYHSHCLSGPGQQGAYRRSIIMISCAPGEMEGRARFVVENNQRDKDCFYLFEIEHDALCVKTDEFKLYGLSAGSVVCIIFFTLVGVYLLVGFLYSRFVLGAKGVDQIPNYSFWQDFGNLQADGCDLVCRSGRYSGYREPKQYRGIGDDQLEEEERHDDSLLPM